MAEVLGEHQKKTGIRDLAEHCTCGWAGREKYSGYLLTHQEAMLTAAGFGPVKAAQAEALRDAADDFGATYHGNWLRARADAIGVGK
jgi:hypothetical protein